MEREATREGRRWRRIRRGSSRLPAAGHAPLPGVGALVTPSNPSSHHTAATMAAATIPTETAGPAQAIVAPTEVADRNVATCLGACARPVTPPRTPSGASAWTIDPVTVNIAEVAASASATVRQPAASHPGVGETAPLPRATVSTARIPARTADVCRSSRAGHTRCQTSVTQLAPASAPRAAASAINHRYSTADSATVIAGASTPTGSANARTTSARVAWPSRRTPRSADQASRSEPVPDIGCGSPAPRPSVNAASSGRKPAAQRMRATPV